MYRPSNWKTRLGKLRSHEEQTAVQCWHDLHASIWKAAFLVQRNRCPSHRQALTGRLRRNWSHRTPVRYHTRRIWSRCRVESACVCKRSNPRSQRPGAHSTVSKGRMTRAGGKSGLAGVLRPRVEMKIVPILKLNQYLSGAVEEQQLAFGIGKCALTRGVPSKSSFCRVSSRH